MYAISRQQRKPGLWYWSVLFSRRGKLYYKSFYDIRRGGSKKAQAAAIAWRDEKLASVQALTKREFCQLKRTTNRSGVPGVHFIIPKNQPQGSWAARLKMPDGKERTKTFSVQKYGERAAFKLAVKARAQLLEAIDDKPFLHHSVAKRINGTALSLKSA